MRAISVFFVAAIFFVNCNAAFVDGSRLSQWINSADKMENKTFTTEDFANYMRFSGYVQGVFDSLKESGVLCTPEGTGIKQIQAIVKKYVLSNPEQWGLSGATLVLRALKPVFPC